MATRGTRPRSDDRHREPILVGGEQLRDLVPPSRGGGAKYHPFDVAETRERLGTALRDLAQTANQMPAPLRGERVAFQLTLLPNYLSSTYFPAELLDAADLSLIGTRGDRARYRTRTIDETRPTTSLIVAGTERSLAQLEHLVTQVSQREGVPAEARQLREMSEIRLARPDEILKTRETAVEAERTDEAEQNESWEAVLQVLLGARRGTSDPSVRAKWRRFVRELGGSVDDDGTRELDGLAFVPTRLDPLALERAAAFNPLRAIRRRPHFRPVPGTSLLRGARPASVVAAPDGLRPSTDTRIAVFDGGIDLRSPALANYAALSHLTPEPADPEDIAHGCLVTSAVLHGYPLPGGVLRTPTVGVDHYRISPVPTDEHSDEDCNGTLDRIEQTVRAGQYRLVNLSLGPRRPMDDDDPHLWTGRLDHLAVEQDVLFVVAVGNDGDRDHDLGFDRIQVPADIVNGLAVGASNVPHDNANWARAPYSCVGPGREGDRVRPSGLAFGGDPSGIEFCGIGPSGVWLRSWGTSYSAPLVTHGLADVLSRGFIRGKVVNTLRALAIHNAEKPRQPSERDHVGHGRLPISYDPALTNEPDEVTVVYEDIIARGSVVALSLPWPDGVQNGRARMRWTLAYTSPVNLADAAQYTRAAIEPHFRPHAQRHNVLDPSGRIIGVVDLQDRAQVQAHLDQGRTLSAKPKARPMGDGRTWPSERESRDAGKWETVIDVNQGMDAKSLYRPRLELEYFARDGRLVDAEDAPDLPYTLVVTFTGPRGSELYRRAREQFRVLTPITQSIRVGVTRTEVDT
jgi:hypothetical protein